MFFPNRSRRNSKTKMDSLQAAACALQPLPWFLAHDFRTVSDVDFPCIDSFDLLILKRRKALFFGAGLSYSGAQGSAERCSLNVPTPGPGRRARSLTLMRGSLLPRRRRLREGRKQVIPAGYYPPGAAESKIYGIPGKKTSMECPGMRDTAPKLRRPCTLPAVVTG